MRICHLRLARRLVVSLARACGFSQCVASCITPSYSTSRAPAGDSKNTTDSRSPQPPTPANLPNRQTEPAPRDANSVDRRSRLLLIAHPPPPPPPRGGWSVSLGRSPLVAAALAVSGLVVAAALAASGLVVAAGPALAQTPPAVSGPAAVSYAENASVAVATYAVADPDANASHSWTLEGDDAGDFAISAAGELSFNAPPDYEKPVDATLDNDYSVTVKATDNGTPALSDAVAVTVTVTDVAAAAAQTEAVDSTTKDVTFTLSGDASADVTLTVTRAGASAPAGTSVTLPETAANRMAGASKEVTVKAVTLTIAQQTRTTGYRFRTGAAAADITGIELASGETATVCLPAGADGTSVLRVLRYDDEASRWVPLTNPRIVTRDSARFVCGDTNTFSAFRAAQPTAPAVIQAHEYSGSGGSVASNELAPDYTSVGGIGAGDWISFDGVDFSGSPDILMVFLAAGAGDVGDRIEVRLDAVSGAKIADLAIADTGGDQVFSEQYASVSGASGVHDVYLVFPSATQANIDWFVFSKNPDGETDGERVQRIQWWRDARFGQFIHWGAYSHLAGSHNGNSVPVDKVAEWIMLFLGIPINDYETSAAVPFNPTSFNAGYWARVAKEAGHKYVVITSKHHEGFSMFDTNVRGFQTRSPSISPARDYDISDVGSYGSDPIAELASATRAQGLRFGLYYSISDWHFVTDDFDTSTQATGGDLNLGDFMDHAKYMPAMKEQLRELVEKYDPALLWFDAEWIRVWTRPIGEALYKYLRVLKPDLMINDRVAKRSFFVHGDGDYDTTAEREAPAYPSVDWEKSQTMNDTWGYRADDTNWKPASQLIEELVSVTSRNGNYLLNIGPDGTGTIPSASVARLETVGDWLATHGPAVYGTDKPNPLKEKPSWGWYTTKGNTVYAIVKDWPADGRLELEDLNSKVTWVSSLSSPGTTYGTSTLGSRVTVTGLPATAPSSHLSVLELSIEGEIGGAARNLALNRPVEVSDFYNSDARYNGAKAVDEMDGTRWATSDGETTGTLTVDLDGSQTFDRIVVKEPAESIHQRVTEYTVEYWNGAWVNLHNGKTIGDSKSIAFTAVSGSRVRLRITGASGPPTISEFQVYEVVPQRSLAYNRPAAVSDEVNTTFNGAKAVDGFDGTRWATNDGVTTATLTVDLDGPQTFDRIVVKEPAEGDGTLHRVTSYTLEYLNGAAWANLHNGTTIGDNKSITFTAASGSKVRLSITGASGPPTISEFQVWPQRSLAYNRPTAVSDFYNSDARFNGAKAVDGFDGTRWATNDGVTNATLTVDLDGQQTFDRIVVKEPAENAGAYHRVTSYTLEYLNGTTWANLHNGMTIGDRESIAFTAVSGSKVRLSITGASGSPTISEFQVYEAVSQRSLAYNRPAAVSDFLNSDARFNGAKAVDGFDGTRWATNDGVTNATLTVDLDGQQTFDRIVVKEPAENAGAYHRVTSYTLEYLNGATWANLRNGTTIGDRESITFAEVSGSRVRLRITGASGPPTISEFQVYEVVPQRSLAYNRPAGVSDFFNSDARFNGAKAVDEMDGTRWATNAGVTNATLTVDLDGQQTFDRIVVKEPAEGDGVYHRVTSYTLEYWNGAAWVHLHIGKTIGDRESITFTAVSGSKVRLSITGASEPPTISEFQVWPQRSLAYNRPTKVSDFYNSDARFNGAKAVDQMDGTRWATNDGVTNATLTVDLDGQQTFDRIVVKEPAEGDGTLHRVTSYTLEYWNDGAWVNLRNGMTIGDSESITFTEVSGSKVRLRITGASGSPTISEFQVYDDDDPEAAQPTGPAVIQAHEYSGSGGSVASNELAPDYTSVGGIGAGDWISFDGVDFSGSPDILMVFLAAGAGDVGDRIEVRLDAVSGAKIADLAIADTGGDQVFSEQYASVSGASGVHDVYLVFPSATQANIDWFVFSKNPDGETDGERVQRIQWWRDARFGQFIHWGAYSHLAGSHNGNSVPVDKVAEWIMLFLGIPINDYETSAAVPFNPTSFNAGYWARVAKEAGHKYVVITSKHHEGFSMFDTNVRGFQTRSPSISPARDYDISDVGSYGSDPIAELASATRAQGLRFGLYYSISDWHFVTDDFDTSTQATGGDLNLGDFMDHAKYMPAMKEQLRELVEKYDPALLWFDAEWIRVWTRPIGEALYKYLRVLKPDLMINDRVAKRSFFVHGDGDYDTTAEREAPAYPSVDWEKSQTMNDTWGYRADDTNWKPASQLIEELVSVTSRNGNYLLNIGPDGTGTIPSASVARLETVGDWLATHGPAVYGTDKPNPLKESRRGDGTPQRATLSMPSSRIGRRTAGSSWKTSTAR